MEHYLYVKTHNVTSLKYLGKTKSKDPHGYTGSGTYWLDHLNKNGYDYSTKILLVTEDMQELKETGLFFSKLWNVVESGEWANYRPEQGDGGDTVSTKMWITDGIKEKYIEKNSIIPEGFHKGRNNKCSFKNSEQQSKNSKLSNQEKRNKTYKENKEAGLHNKIKKEVPSVRGELNAMKRPENRLKISIWSKSNKHLVGAVWYNNGVKRLRLYPHQEIPEGFVKGKIFSKRTNKNDKS